MRNDRIQGILFSRSLHVDLARRSRRQEFMLKVRATRHYLQEKRLLTTDTVLKSNPLAAQKQLRAEQKRYKELNELLGRFKDRD